MPPETRYARSGDVSIAYQVVGDGPIDVVFVPGWISNLDLLWENPISTAFFERIATFSRLIVFDKRGTGLSDRVVETALDTRMDDVRAVMDGAGSERAAIWGISEGGPMSIVFAATYPERVRALVLYGTTPRLTEASDYPIGAETDRGLAALEDLARHAWGQGRTMEYFMPSLANVEGFREEMAKWERMSASPSAALAQLAWLRQIDVRPILPTIHVPTLVAHRAGDIAVPASHGRYIAERIPGARYFEQPGDDHVPWLGESAALVEEVQEFLTGSRGDAEADRVLATVLFTDIVGSTEKAAEMGDHRWRELLGRHDALCRQQVERFRGRLIKSTGDGLLATFDGPVRGIRAACAARDSLRAFGVDIRAGLHTGEIELRGHDVGGLAVHIGARVAAKAAPGEILVSSTVKDLVAGAGLSFADRGAHELKGIPESWRLYSLN